MIKRILKVLVAMLVFIVLISIPIAFLGAFAGKPIMLIPCGLSLVIGIIWYILTGKDPFTSIIDILIEE